MILDRKDVFLQSVDDWTKKWAPAILEFGYTLTGKKATMVLTAQKEYEGVHVHETLQDSMTLHMHMHIYT